MIATARAPLLLLLLALATVVWIVPGSRSLAAQEAVRVAGTVTDETTGQPIEGAMVRLADFAGSVRETLSGSAGGFAFEGVAPGEYVLGVRRIGYEGLSTPLEIGPGGLATLNLGLTPQAIPLEPLNVDVEGRAPRLAETGFYDRLEEGWGTYFEPEWIRTRSVGFIRLSRFVSNLQGRAPLSRCAQVQVWYDERFIGYTSAWGTSGPVSINAAGLHRSAVGPAPRILDELSVTDVGAAELYTPPAPIPLFALNDTTAVCGAIILWSDWTARTAEIPQVDVKLCEPAGHAGEVALDGFVEDELTGVRLPAAHVFATYPTSEGALRRDLAVRTDSLGRYRLCDLPAGAAVELEAAYGPETGRRDVFEAASGTEVRLIVQVTMPGAITGLVVNEGTGRPFRNVPVVLVGTDFRAVTNTAGRFSVEGLPPGAYRLRAICEGFESLAQDVELVPGASVRVMLALRPEGPLPPRRCAG
ncbi:carboxypeptidase regulatory-like domain-containing protein [Candidatus Palauibacter sp.]|uniref:carboxypeptidase regulatory-like domain-containing protein n=1 Tax=Candidatus Palauibacter sp. TaxID=3101350 RepID=UPI003CC61E56